MFILEEVSVCGYSFFFLKCSTKKSKIETKAEKSREKRKMKKKKTKTRPAEAKKTKEVVKKKTKRKKQVGKIKKIQKLEPPLNIGDNLRGHKDKRQR